MSRRATATVVGCLFVAQMVSAAVGTSMIQSFVDGEAGEAPMRTGVLLMGCAGLAVVAIGLLMYPILRDVDARWALWYPALRVVEFTVSTVCGVYLLATLEVVPNHMLWIYVPTGLGGLVLTYLLVRSRLVPRAVAVLGLVGYACLTAGVPLDLAGVLDMDEGVGLALLAPGGLFEFVVLPIWLIAKGFGPPAVEEVATPALATSG